jgi:glutamate formiminotransferase/formiminotetrahydrofolate cyclodeaminase
MSTPLVKCVPNFSEGRDKARIQQIVDVLGGVAGVRLLDVDPGADTNRTVVTFVGPPEAVAEAAFRITARAAQVIDMRTHRGAHPRMGATDVLPFVPVSGVTMADCAALARQVGARVGAELGIPVFLYEQAASRPERRNLADVRRGEYEGLAQKLTEPAWAPDFGPSAFNPKSGATIIGAREFLIAYNVTLNSTDKNHATDIAFELREKGRVARRGRTTPYYYKGDVLTYAPGRFPCGQCDFDGATADEIRQHTQAVHGYDLDELLRLNDLTPGDLVGLKVHRAGLFKACKAIGWYVDDYKRAQISINLTNYRITAPHAVLDAARRLAAERGLVVTGSEIVGLLPYDALMASGRHYLRAQGRTAGLPPVDVMRAAIHSLGLSDAQPFDPKTKILGAPEVNPRALVHMTVRDLADEVSRDTPAPGGGSIAALAGALGAGLAAMVANLTHGKAAGPGVSPADAEARDVRLSDLAERAQEQKERLLTAVDADTDAFNDFLAARRLPAGTADEKAARQAAMQAGLKHAIEVPWGAARAAFKTLRLAEAALADGNPNSASDAAVGAQMAFSGLRGAVWNVLINLKDIEDAGYVQKMRADARGLIADGQVILDRVVAEMERRLSAGAG